VARRDALTLFDENMAFSQAPAAAVERAAGQTLAGGVWGFAAAAGPSRNWCLFGHALLEKLVLPRKAITAHVLLVQQPTRATADLDAWVAGRH
jgi:hypothetical protein